MKKLALPIAAILFLFSCKSNNWNKEKVSSRCVKEMNGSAKANPLLTGPKVTEICDCIAEKMVAKFKSEAEADKSKTEATQIGKDCAMAILMPK